MYYISTPEVQIRRVLLYDQPFLVLLDFVEQATVVAQAPVVHKTQVSWKPVHGSRPNFVDSSLSIISPYPCFLFSNFSIFYDFFLFRKHGTLWEQGYI